jgi:predicted ribosome quality control (RQC) complex YloA/Tae2 family protein
MANKGRPYRTVDVEGFEILIGKAATDNDYLTLKVAKPHDLWLHVNGVPGSHVVVRNPDKLPEIPKPVVERAAELAAYFSKAREARGKVDVHVCWASDVRKARGAPAGEVQLRRFDRVKVYARPLADGESDDA